MTTAEPVPSSVSNDLPASQSATGQADAEWAQHHLWTVMAAAVQVLRVDSVGLLLIDDHDRLRTVGFTDQPASALEDTQLKIGQGPGIDSWQRRETVAVSDLSTAPAYSALWSLINGSGVRSVLSLPVHSQGLMIGNLNLARHRAHAWTAIEIRAGHAYASVVGLTLTRAATADNAFVSAEYL